MLRTYRFGEARSGEIGFRFSLCNVRSPSESQLGLPKFQRKVGNARGVRVLEQGWAGLDSFDRPSLTSRVGPINGYVEQKGEWRPSDFDDEVLTVLEEWRRGLGVIDASCTNCAIDSSSGLEIPTPLAQVWTSNFHFTRAFSFGSGGSVSQLCISSRPHGLRRALP